MISILYVDDEPGLVALLRHYLQESGEFQVLTAGSGPEALALLERHPVDVVVSDYQMPGMNGIELLRECRRRFDGLPFILFTGRGREEVVIEAIDSGVDFYLQKGGDPEAQFAELALKCRQAVRRQRAEEDLRASEERNRLIIEGSPTGIHLYELEDDSLVFLGANPAADRILGIEHAALVGQTIDDVFPGLRETRGPRSDTGRWPGPDSPGTRTSSRTATAGSRGRTRSGPTRSARGGSWPSSSTSPTASRSRRNSGSSGGSGRWSSRRSASPR